MDRIFEPAGTLKGLQFSFTIADPSLEGCPLIGCSQGFGTLCGYEMDEIVGRNCRFLVDGVPQELVNNSSRTLAREFCAAVMAKQRYQMPEVLREAWMPKARASDDGVFCLQTNERKDGTLFKNMFYLKMMELDEKWYIVGLQTELRAGDDYALYHEACRLLDVNMTQLEHVLSTSFWCSTAMRRQDDVDPEDGFVPDGPGAAPSMIWDATKDGRAGRDVFGQAAPKESSAACSGGF